MRPLSIPAPDGVIDALVFVPDGAGPHPAVLLFSDIGGLRPSYHDKAQRIADGGYAVLMPNIYYRSAAGQVVPAGRSFRDPDMRNMLLGYAAHLTPSAQARDFAALLAAIAADPAFADGAIGTVGYCMTGAFALRLAALHPDRVGAAAAFHAARLADVNDPDSVVHAVGGIAARVYLGHADRDALMPPEQIAAMDRALAEAGVHFTTELYKGALHGFTATDAPVYNPAADALHFKRLFTLLDETLGDGSVLF